MLETVTFRRGPLSVRIGEEPTSVAVQDALARVAEAIGPAEARDLRRAWERLGQPLQQCSLETDAFVRDLFDLAQTVQFLRDSARENPDAVAALDAVQNAIFDELQDGLSRCRCFPNVRHCRIEVTLGR